MQLDPRVIQIAAEVDPSRRVERLLDAACDLLAADGATLARVDAGVVRVVRERGAVLAPVGGRGPAGDDLSEAVIRAGRPVRRAVPEPGLAVPIRGEGGLTGILSVHRAGAGAFSDDDESLLALLAALAGSALRETTLVEQARGSLVDAVESLEDGLLLYDASDRLVLANRRVCELVPAVADLIKPGVRFDDVVRAAAARGYYRHASGDVDDVVSARLAREMPPDGRLAMHLEDGRVVQVKETRTRDGGRLILVTDVTELRRATAALEVSERNYRMMVDGVDDIMYRTDANGIFTYVNPRVQEVLGWTAEEIVGTHYLDLIDPAHRAAAGRFYLRQLGRHIPTTYYEFPATARDGSLVWVGQHVRLVEEDGKVVGALSVARDITARRRADAHDRDRLRIVEGIARNAPLQETLEQLVGLFERRTPGWRCAVVLSQGGRPRTVVAPDWEPALLAALGVPEKPEPPAGPPLCKTDLAGRTAWTAPIRGRDDGITGLWAMVSDDGREPDTETTLLASELVQLAAVAVEHARLTERLQARVERARALNHLAQLLSSSLDLETVLSEIARAASALLGAPVARFWMVDEAEQTIWLAADAAEGSGGVDHGPEKLNVADLSGVLGWVAANRQPAMIPHAADDPRVRDAAWWAARGLTSFLGQPVLLDGRLLAVLVLWGREPFTFDADDEALLESFVSQAALSIRNAQLYRDTDQQRRRLQSLVEVSHRLSRGLDLTEVLDAITEAAAAIFHGEAGVRLLVGDELVRASVSRGARQRPSMERITTRGGLIGEVLRTGQPASTSDVTSEQRIATPFREILQHDRMTALLVAPIRHDGRVLGTLHIYRERGHEWRDDAHLLAAGLADQAATAIENATRYAGLQDSLERAKIPARVNQLLTAALDLDVLLREIASAAVTITGADLASLWLADEETRSLTLAVVSNESIGAGRSTRRLAFGEGRAGWVAQHRRPLAVDDVFEDERTIEPDWWRRHGLTSAYSLPVLDGDRLVAVISIDGREPIQVGDENRDLLNALVAQTTAALRNAALYREISAANRRLEQEVRRNELLLNSVADGVFGVDADGRISFVNPAALRMLDYRLGDLLHHDADARLHHPVDHEAAAGAPACPFATALRHGQAYRISEDVLWRCDGQGIPVECVVTPLFQDGTSVGAVATFRDISREKEAQQQRHALAQSEKLRALGQLAGGVAHDLNQSLGLVVGHSELALEAIGQSPGVPTELRESLEAIMQGALDGAQTVKRLQTFVRGQPEGEAERISVSALLADVARLTAPRWRDDAQAAGAPVSVSVNATLTGGDEIMGWPASLREALTNLVFNAVDAMPQGGDLRLAARGTPSQIVVEVADTGSGMPPEVAARVFEPFFTTKGERGTGLGLAMVYGIVERHAGRIEVDSAVGRGTTFRIALPRAAGGSATRAGERDESATRPRTILIVDDEAALRRMLTRMLQVDGHTVVAAATAAEALHHLRKQRFDLVLSDHGLGVGMNGLELATAVRDVWPGTRFILVTGWGGSIDPAEVEPLGVEAVIAKPYRAPELRERINARP